MGAIEKRTHGAQRKNMRGVVKLMIVDGVSKVVGLCQDKEDFWSVFKGDGVFYWVLF